MKTIAENLASAMAKTNPDKKLGIIVTARGSLPKTFNLKSFEGLDGLYHGQLTHAEIKKLAQTENVQSVELDAENTIL